MKKLSKLIALILALALVLGMSAAVWADDDPTKNDSITVNNAKVGETYSAYKLFDLKVNSEIEPTAYSYTVNSDWADFFKPAEGENAAGPGNQYVTINSAGYVVAISDAAALAKEAAAWTGKPAAAKSVTVAAEQTTAVFTGLEDGYWLITSTLGTFAMTETTPDKNAVTVEEKNEEDTITKQVKEDSNGTFGDNNDAQIGDTIEFKSTVKIVKGTRNVVVHDKMDSGLTYTAGSVAIADLTKDTEYTVNESPADDDTFDIVFDQDWIDALDFGEAAYKEYFITYAATLNENAVVSGEGGVAIVGQNNKTHVSFGDGTNSAEDSTVTTTHKFSVFKHAKDSTDNLADAVFSLKKAGTVVKLIKLDDNNYRVANGDEASAVETFTTVASGDIVIWGVDADSDYTLEETAPPDGYNKLNAEVPVTVDAGNATRIDVENNSGAELPSTGGIGTTIFYVVGAILVIGAGILLVSKKKVGKGE